MPARCQLAGHLDAALPQPLMNKCRRVQRYTQKFDEQSFEIINLFTKKQGRGVLILETTNAVIRFVFKSNTEACRSLVMIDIFKTGFN